MAVDKTYLNLWCPFIGLKFDLSVQHTYVKETNGERKKGHKSYIGTSTDGSTYFSIDSSIFMSIATDSRFSKFHKGETGYFGFSYGKWYDLRRDLLRFRDSVLPTIFEFGQNGIATFARELSEADYAVIDNHTSKGLSTLTFLPYLASTQVFSDGTDFECERGYPAIGLFIDGVIFSVAYLDAFYSFVDYLQDLNIPTMAASARIESRVNDIQFTRGNASSGNGRTNAPVNQPTLPKGIKVRSNNTV